ncbi:hypothetical protein [Leucobacter luti]|uniref:hypothetical protein n=1 Tax=Leucobacter luti TaxID=340320 RepID=UPI003D032163
MNEIVKLVAKNLAGRLGCVPDDAGCVEHPERAWDAGYGLCGVAVMLAEDAVATVQAEPDETAERPYAEEVDHEYGAWDTDDLEEHAHEMLAVVRHRRAAAGPAPQAPSIDREKLIERAASAISEHLVKRGRVSTYLEMAEDALTAVGFITTPTVLDEGKIAEVAKMLRVKANAIHESDPDGAWSDCYESERESWLKLVRAVVEALGGAR